MKSGVTDREMVRQYLLGRLDITDEMESKVSDEIFLDDDLLEMVDSVEGEIIEGYVEGTLDSADRKSVEGYFLRSPERRAELRFFKILQNHLAAKREDVIKARADLLLAREQGMSRARITRNLRSYWGSRVIIYGQAAVLVALCIFGPAYLNGIRKQQAILEANLVQERARSSSLATEVSQLRPPIIALTLASDRSRSFGSRISRVGIKPSIQRLIVEIALKGHKGGSYDVYLETKNGNGRLWSATLLPLVSPDGDARLLFDLPVQSLKSGVYSIVVSQGTSGSSFREYYDFEVSVTK